ncbi:hypothetical protein [Aquisalinus flavus]|uniref:Glycosyltransferase n=1 Tax=Aquisalinus flavus TaxID=1526572 RepID=A0A8J2V6N1_9PROT|nr:hypothetical protein [Aquisalinus flavus]MBD0425480.1 hypothetical protein [Aquisalinus flavus]UNE48887.1 hypothetical protein FF099_12910 [Aquisalinus flavus]GGD15721.1 hypothetical protein GCM10011342_25630 [Aquisalinus flavus]
MDKTIICMKWGTRYGPEYVNRLYGAVTRNITGPLRFVCFTDDRTGLNQGIEIQPLPRITLPEPYTWTPWRKISCWQYPLADLRGDVMFLDIDLIITGPLDDLFAYAPGEYCVIENWTQKTRGLGNTSAFRFPAGKHTGLFEIFEANPRKVLEEHRTEQHYISKYIPNQRFWPAEWCVSFKHDLVPPFPFNWFREPVLTPEARIVAFTGRPDPDEAAIGVWPAPLHKRFYKHALPATWVNEHWRE